MLRPVILMQTVGVREHHHAVSLLTQPVHDINHIRADRDKDSLPAFGKLIETQRHIQLVINGFGKFNIGNFAAFMLFKGFAVNKITAQFGQRLAAQITPD